MRHLLPFVALATLAAPSVFAHQEYAIFPKLLQKPTPEQILAVTPAGITAMGSEGRRSPFWVALRCGFNAEGRLVDCVPAGAAYSGTGMEEAALKLIDFYRIEPDYAKANLGRKAMLYISFGWPWTEPPPPRLAPPAPPAPPRNDVVTRPEWIKKPTGAQVEKAFPKAALKAGQSGRVTLSCEVNGDGTVRDCSVVSESPAGMGFDAAALSLTPTFKMRSTMPDGTPVAGKKVRTPFSFSAPPR